MTIASKRRMVAWLILLGNAVLWAIPSNIVKLVATDRDTLLGWYSLEKLSGQLFLLAISLPVVYVLRASGPAARKRLFAVMAVLLVLLPGLVVTDIVGRMVRKPRYAQHEGFRSRPPNSSYGLVFHDVPQAKRTYPNAPSGYQPVACRLSVDSRGFRNRRALDRCDILTIGDSFTEGSNVSDDQPWPVLLERYSGRSVYNLGMSGGDTQEYLLAYENVGKALGPRLVLCMVFEGNDFRGTNITSDRGQAKPRRGWRSVEKYFKESPLVGPTRQGLVGLLGPINARGYVPGGGILSWIPVAVSGSDPRFYAFTPKDLLAYRTSRREFVESRGWTDAALALGQLAGDCRAQGARLVIVYAPHKVHVLWPLVCERLPADKVRAFAALNARRLPPADEFTQQVLAGLEVKESVLAEFCHSEGIEFVSLTGPLREGLWRGRQLYYTYDQHWTPEGHEAVAQTVLQAARE